MKKNKFIALSLLMAMVMMFSATVSVSAASFADKLKEMAVSKGYNAEYPVEVRCVYQNKVDFSGGDTFVLDGRENQAKIGFMKFDFTSIDLTEYPAMQLKLTGYKAGNPVGNPIEIKISVIPNSLENKATVSSLTYTAASEAGWLTAGEEIGTISGTMPETPKTPAFYSTDILSAIKANVTDTDKTVVLKLETNLVDAVTYYSDWSDVGYYKENVHVVPMLETDVTAGQANAQADAEELTVPETAQAGDTLALPSAGSVNASKITWKSNSEYIDAATGAVKPVAGFSDKVVTLTATVVNNYIVVKKEFQVTVKASMIKTLDEYVTIKAHGTGFDNSPKNQPRYLIVNPQFSNNRHQGILRFNITDIKNNIDRLEDVSLRLTFAFIKETTGADLTTGQYQLQILPDIDWTVANMTFDYLYKYGVTEENPSGTNLFGQAVLAAKSGTVPTIKGNTMVFSGLKAAIKDYITKYPEATRITFLLAGENPDNNRIEDSVRFYVPNGAEDRATAATEPMLIGETGKRFTAQNDNGAVTFTYNVDSQKYPAGINQPATFFAAEYNSAGQLVNVMLESDADSVITNGETKTVTISGYTAGNTVKAMVFNGLSELMPLQTSVILGN